MKNCRHCIVLILLVLLASVTMASAEEVTVATGKTFIDLVFTPIKEKLAAKGMTVVIDYAKPVEALQKVDAGKAELGGASLNNEDWLAMAASGGVTLKNKDSFTFFTVMEEETVIIVNQQNPVKSLTKEQVKGIFTGKIQNWKEVGGSDEMIVVVWPQVSSGGTELFIKKMLDGAPLCKDLLEVPTISDLPEMVAPNREAISIANGASDTRVRALESPRIVRPLTLVSNGKPSAKAQKLLDFLAGEGKALFKK